MIRKFLFILLLSYIPAAAQQSFNWVQNHQINYSFNPGIPKTLSCKGVNTEVWFAYYDSVYSSWSLDPLGNITLNRMNTAGTVLQTYQIGPRAMIHDMITNQNGELMVIGAFIDTLFINQSDTLMNTAVALNLEPFLICFDVAGQVKWKHNLGVGLTTSFISPTLEMSPSGEIYYSYTDFSTGYIIHIDNNGLPIGQVVVDGIRTIGDFGFTPTGGLFVTGATGNGSVFSIGALAAPVTESYMLYIAYVNPIGNGQWVHLAHDVTFQFPQLVTDPLGNAYVCAALLDSLTWGNFHLNGPDWVYDYFLAKVDSNGLFQWVKEGQNPTGGIVGDFGPAATRSIACDAQGRVMLCGIQRGSVDWGNGFVATTGFTSLGNLTAVLFDATGTTQSLKMAMGSQTKSVHSIIQENDAFYVTGTSTTDPGVMFDTIQVDFLYNQNAFITRIGATPVGTFEPQENETTIFPNPGSGVFQIPQHWADQYPIEILDLSGHMVDRLTTANTTINIQRLAKGMYVLRHGTESIRVMKD